MIGVAIIHASYIDPPEGLYNAEGTVAEDKATELINANIEKTLKMLREAGEKDADIAVTNEDFADIGRYIRHVGQPGLFPKFAAQAEGYISRELCTIAREYGMLIAANSYEIYEGGIYNTSKLVGRDGEYIGKYRKIHLPPGEKFQVQPGGGKPPVFKTDIGNIGFATCYDIIFPEHCRILALDGADMIIHQTQGWGTGAKSSAQTGEAFMRVRAAENGVYLIVAKNIQNEGGMSCIVSNHGDLVSSTGGPEDNVLITKIRPDYDMCDIYHYDNYYAGVESAKARKLLGRSPDSYKRLSEGGPLFISPGQEGARLRTYEEWVRCITDLDEMDDGEKSKFYW